MEYRSLGRTGVQVSALCLGCMMFGGRTEPEESYGILPHQVDFGLRFMSIASFTGEHGVPMRGEDVTNAILELLAVTIWHELDVLVIDMPPGIGDEVLDLIRFIRRSEIIIVTSPSMVSVRVVKRLLDVFMMLKIQVLGVVANLVDSSLEDSYRNAQDLADVEKVAFLGSIPYIPDFERCIGSPKDLVSSVFGEKMGGILGKITGDYHF